MLTAFSLGPRDFWNDVLQNHAGHPTSALLEQEQKMPHHLYNIQYVFVVFL